MHSQIEYVLWDFHSMHHSSNADIRKYTLTRMLIHKQLQCVKRITEYPD